jgi:ACS family 4-hydroxyphenylacetate permease-like MFS transporter
MVALSVCGWSIVVLAEAAVGKMVGLTLCTIGIFSAYGIFWAMVGTVLSRETAPIGIAVITTTGIFASILSPSIVGILRDMTGGFEAGIWYAASLLLLGMVLIVLASKLPSKAIAQSAI